MRAIGLVLALLALPFMGYAQAPENETSIGKTPHSKEAACYELRSGLANAHNLDWVPEAQKAAALQGPMNELEFLAANLAAALENGFAVEDTRTLHHDFEASGLRFLAKARSLGVDLPADRLKYQLKTSEDCAEPYRRLR